MSDGCRPASAIAARQAPRARAPSGRVALRVSSEKPTPRTAVLPRPCHMTGLLYSGPPRPSALYPPSPFPQSLTSRGARSGMRERGDPAVLEREGVGLTVYRSERPPLDRPSPRIGRGEGGEGRQPRPTITPAPGAIAAGAGRRAAART